MNQDRFKKLCIILVLAVFIACQWHSLSNSTAENYDSWRQSDTYRIAVNYYEKDFNILKPQLNYDGPGDNYVQLEFQIVPYLAALLFKSIGYATPFIPRFLNLLLFCGSAWFVYRIANKFTSFYPALGSFLIYLATPLCLLYSRAVMPEATALFFYCGAVYFLLLWQEKNRFAMVLLSATFTALAIMEKTPLIFIGILILYVFAKKYGLAALKQKEFYLYGIVGLIVPLAYLYISTKISTTHFINGIAEYHIFSKEILTAFSPQGVAFFRSTLAMYFGWASILCALGGLLLSLRSKLHFCLVWALAMILEWIVIVAVIQFNYYEIFMAPVVAVLCGLSFEFLGRRWRPLAVVCAVLIIGFTGLKGYDAYRQYVSVNKEVAAVAAFIEAHTDAAETVVIGTDNPVYMNMAGRFGFRAIVNSKLSVYDATPSGDAAKIQYYKDAGATRFIVVNDTIDGDDNGSMLAYVAAHYRVSAENKNCTIYALDEL